MQTTTASGSWSEKIIIRFGTTFVANALRAALSFLSGILIARGLGASAYGDLNFLIGSFVAMSQVMDLGTSSAFYTFISKRRRSRSFALLYLGWMVVQFGGTFVVVGLLLPESVVQRVWIGHDRGIILLALTSSFLTTQLWGMVSQLGEATRKTVIIQVATVIQAVVHLALIGLTIYLGWLSVSMVMWLLLAEYLLLGLVMGPGLLKTNIDDDQPDGRYRATIREFWTYCSPLVIYGLVGFFYSFADRWFLQLFGGSEQQGFYSIGAQVASISLIATQSMLRVFWKEVAEARDRKDHQRVRMLYSAVCRSLYFAGAGLSCLLIPYSREILIRTVGIAYERAWPCLALMFLFPLYQSLGQIQSALFFASEETRSYARIGLLMMGISIPVTYFVLAPRSAAIAGLGLGAAGLAVKLVVLAIISVNIQGYVIARSNKWSYEYAYQAIVPTVLLAFSWGAKWLSGLTLSLAGSAGSPVKVMVLGSLLYLGLAFAFVYLDPSVAGLTREHARHVVGDTVRWLRSVRA